MDPSSILLIGVYAAHENTIMGGVERFNQFCEVVKDIASKTVIQLYQGTLELGPFKGQLDRIVISPNDGLIHAMRVDGTLQISGGSKQFKLLAKSIESVVNQLVAQSSDEEWYTLVWWPEHPYLDSSSEEVTFLVFRDPSPAKVARRS